MLLNWQLLINSAFFSVRWFLFTNLCINFAPVLFSLNWCFMMLLRSMNTLAIFLFLHPPLHKTFSIFQFIKMKSQCLNFINSFQHDLFWPSIFNNLFYFSWSSMIGFTHFWWMCIFSLLNIKWRILVGQNSFGGKVYWVGLSHSKKNYIDRHCLSDCSLTFSTLQSNGV